MSQCQPRSRNLNTWLPAKRRVKRNLSLHMLFPEADSILTKEKNNTFSSCGPSNTNNNNKKSISHFLKSIIIFHCDISETVAGITYSKTWRLFCSVSLFLASVDFTLLSTSDCKESDSIFRARNSSIKSPYLRDMMQLSGRDISHIWTTPILGHHKASTFEKGGKWNLKRHTDSYRTDPCVSAFCCFQVQFVKSSAFLDTRCFSLSYRGKTAVRRIKVGNYHWKICAKKSWY